MANINELYQGEFLRADQLGGVPRRAVIEATTVEVIGQGENASQKLVLKFTKGKQRLPLNKTNALTLAAAWGPNSDNWMGRTIELRSEKVAFSGRIVDAIRVRAVAAPAPAAALAPAPVAPPEPPAELPDEAGVADMADDIPW